MIVVTFTGFTAHTVHSRTAATPRAVQLPAGRLASLHSRPRLADEPRTALARASRNILEPDASHLPTQVSTPRNVTGALVAYFSEGHENLTRPGVSVFYSTVHACVLLQIAP